MKTKKSIWTILLAVVLGIMTAVVFTGCSSSNDNKPAANSSGAPADDSLSKIKAKGKIVVGINAEFAPYEFHAMVDGKDTVAGFDVDLAKAIAKDMGVELELKELSFDALLTTLQSGQIDVVISGMSATEERRKSVDFSNAYYKGDQVVMVSKEDAEKYNSLQDFKGKKIGVQLGSLQEKLMQTLLPEGDYVKIESMNTLFLSLKSHQIDGIATTGLVAEMAIAANPEFAIAKKAPVDDSSLNSPGSAVGMRKNSAALQAQINSTIKRLQDSGEFQKYVDVACKLAGTTQKK